MNTLSVPRDKVFVKDTLINGQPASIPCVEIDGQTFCVTGDLIRMLQLEDEWFEEVRHPDVVVETLRTEPVGADILTFCQRLPRVEPRFPYYFESESIAALPIQSYEHWWNKQIESATRNKIRKSAKAGVEVRPCAYDDDFVRGITAIFNETPVRQGRQFWHYGKDFQTIKQQFARFLFREELLGAFYQGELIGFAMLGKTEHFADLGQIISKVEHRDKAPTNALIAKAVELCGARGIPYLVYAFWLDDSLGEFKRQSGFQRVDLPRYYVPLTIKGRLALRTGAHRGWRSFVPPGLKTTLKRWRADWYART